jgi:hypothetical protein
MFRREYRHSALGTMKGLLLVSVLALCAWACVNLQAAQASAPLPRDDIYRRATNTFAEACFFKPAEAKTNDPAFSLAPLILQEVSGSTERYYRMDRFGTLSLSNGVPALEPSRPAIYWQTDSVQLSGKAHARFTYVWCYSAAASDSKRGPGADSLSPAQAEADLTVQGIRITLNTNGQPVIWEALADNSGAELIFVSQTLEAAALAEHGKPLPGRHHAIERRTQEAPKVIVARVIDDGPVTMGPIVYLSAGTRNISTLICRCMPAQAKKLLDTSTYELLPLNALTVQSLLTKSKEQATFWSGDQRPDDRLDHCLRLPSAF